MPEISQTGDTMLLVLEVVARNGPLSARDVAEQCKINRTVAYRLLNTLWQRHYLRQTPDGFLLGHAILGLSKSLECDLPQIARALLQDLTHTIGETVVLHCIDRDEVIVVEQALGERHLVRVQHALGARHPLTSGAGGWLLLAFQDDLTINRILRTCAVPSETWQRIVQIRERGYAVSHDEVKEGVHALAVPVRGIKSSCDASLTVLVPSIRANIIEGFLPGLRSCADRISLALHQACNLH